jgi:hypothetical protein
MQQLCQLVCTRLICYAITHIQLINTPPQGVPAPGAIYQLPMLPFKHVCSSLFASCRTRKFPRRLRMDIWV